MTDKRPSGRNGSDNQQPLAKIQHSRAHRNPEDPHPDDQAALVADPRNRAQRETIDPATHERKLARE